MNVRSRVGVRAWGAALAVMVVAALGACASDRPVGELVGSWGQTEDWVEAAMSIETVALSTDEEREQWLLDHAGDAAAGSSFDDLRAVDLDDHVVVVGGYTRCTERSVILLEDEGALRFTVVTEDEGTDCAWAPYTIDAWAVPLSLTDVEVPEIRHGDRVSGRYEGRDDDAGGASEHEMDCVATTESVC